MLRFPPKRILVAVDLSPTSLDAWRYGAAWGKRFGAQLKALYARGSGPLEIPGAPRIPGGESAMDRDLEEEFQRQTGSPELEIFEGDPIVTLLREAKAWKAELLIMGTHGRTGMPRLLLGSVAEALLRESPIPVLVVHDGPRPIRSVLAPINFTHYAEQAFLYAAAVAGNLEARLTVHHVAGSGETFAVSRERLEEELRRLPKDVSAACSPRAIVSRGKPPEAIARVSGGYDLVVLSGHRKGLLRDLLAGTTAQQVLRGARTPLLAVPAAVGAGNFTLNRWATASD